MPNREDNCLDKEPVAWDVGKDVRSGCAPGFKVGKSGFPISKKTGTQLMHRKSNISKVDKLLDRLDIDRGDG